VVFRWAQERRLKEGGRLIDEMNTLWELNFCDPGIFESLVSAKISSREITIIDLSFIGPKLQTTISLSREVDLFGP